MNAHLSQIPAQLITEESRGQFGFDRYIYGTYNEMVKLLGKRRSYNAVDQRRFS